MYSGATVVEFIPNIFTDYLYPTVVPAKSDSDVMFCLQSYQGLRIDRSLEY